VTANLTRSRWIVTSWMLFASTGVQRVFPRLLLRQLAQMQTIHKTRDSSGRRVPRRSVDLEVVEDSEPEREALRQSQKVERKRRKLAATHPSELATMPENSGPSKIIEISGAYPALFFFHAHKLTCVPLKTIVFPPAQ
jgi:hypothetical protein